MLLQQFDDLSDMAVNYFEGTVVSVSILGRQENGSAKKQLEVILSFFEHAHNNLSGVEASMISSSRLRREVISQLSR